MSKQTREGGEVNRRLAGWPRFILLGLLVSTMGFLSGCEERQENRDQLSFQSVLPEGWQVVNKDRAGRVSRADTDGDQEEEWILLYSFDTPGNTAFTPIGGAIYHTVRREPRLPIIYPYHLQAPGWSYLGEGIGRVTVRVEDMVTHIEPDDTYPADTYFAPQEVIVESRDVDGRITRAAIFQWRNTVPPGEHRKRIDPQEWLVIPGHMPERNSQWYHCIGVFDGTLRVEVGQNQVAVWERLNDRSQIARVNTYKLSGTAAHPNPPNGYLDPNHQLIVPDSSCLGLGFGLPPDVSQSPYPEKIVMAFHEKFLSEENSYGDGFLTPSASKKRASDANWRLFAPQSRPLLQAPCIKEIRYDPPAETSSKASSFGGAEGSEPPQITAQVTTVVEYQPGKPKQVVWLLVQEENTWKINDVSETR
jgi:hypothetical protein